MNFLKIKNFSKILRKPQNSQILGFFQDPGGVATGWVWDPLAKGSDLSLLPKIQIILKLFGFWKGPALDGIPFEGGSRSRTGPGKIDLFGPFCQIWGSQNPKFGRNRPLRRGRFRPSRTGQRPVRLPTDRRSVGIGSTVGRSGRIDRRSIRVDGPEGTIDVDDPKDHRLAIGSINPPPVGGGLIDPIAYARSVGHRRWPTIERVKKVRYVVPYFFNMATGPVVDDPP